MKKALKLASSVHGLTSPDPAVGAVIVKGGKVISTGYHDRFTAPHAEEFAIKKAGKKAKGATIYVNLEPCCHFGNNPPCADNIIRAGIKRVVAAMKDPNPLVCGKGFSRLRKAGVEVVTGVLEDEARKLNEHFVKHITTKDPFVTLKAAVTLDGKIATRTGSSFWISGEQARKYSYKKRGTFDAVLVGVGTVLADDPLLTSHGAASREPLRVIADSSAKTPVGAKVIKDRSARTIIAVTSKARPSAVSKLEKAGASVIRVPGHNGRVDLKALLKALGKMGITSVLIEGGGEISGSAIEKGLVDKVFFVIAPKIVGGKDAKTAVEGTGIDLMKNAVNIKDVSVRKLGSDVVIEGYIERKK